jgi:hypothetical protein
MAMGAQNPLPSQGYRLYKRNVVLPAHVAGAVVGFRPGFGYYAKVPGMGLPAGPGRLPGGRTTGAAAGAGLSPLDQLNIMQIKSLLTPAAMQTSATQQAIDAIKLQTNAVTDAYAAQQDELRRRQERAAGFAQALASQGKSDAGEIADLYRGAADRLRGYGQGLTGDVAAAEQAQTEKTNAAIQGVLGRLGTGTANAASPDAIRNAAQMAGINPQGSSLEAQAVSAAAQALYDAKARAQGVQDISTGYDQQLGDLDAQIAQKKAEIAATAPELRRSALQDLQTLQNQKIATVMQGIALGNTLSNSKSDRAYKAALAAAAGKRTTATPTPRAFQHTTIAGHGVTFNPNTGKYTDQNGNPIPQATIDKWVKQAGAGGGTGKGRAPKGWQSKTINGVTVDFNPNTGTYYLPGDHSTPLTSDDLKALQTDKHITAQEITQFRAQATRGIQRELTKDKKAMPAVILNALVAAGVPHWIAWWALRKEAANHPDSEAWKNVLKKNWARSLPPATDTKGVGA